MERTEYVYVVTISVTEESAESDGIPTESEIARAIYQGIGTVDSEDAVTVERQ